MKKLAFSDLLYRDISISTLSSGRFTTRGLLFLAFSVYLAAAPGLRHADIIASVIGCFLVLLLAAIGAAAVVQGLRLKRTVSLTFAFSSVPDAVDSERCVAGVPHLSSLRVSPRRIFPYFLLTVTPQFEHEEFPPPTLVIKGSDKNPAFVPFELRFPHRGLWQIVMLRCTLRDQFGFTLFSWRIPAHHVICVEPAPVVQSMVPVMSSSHRSGDMAVDVTHREGDPFDLKRYHPSDGMKKILWKVYAKSRNLISRHPEASFTPEGQVALFVIASKEEDAACSEAVAYMARLEEQDLELFLSANSSCGERVAHSAADALDLLVETAWNETASLPSVDNFVSHLLAKLGEAKLDRLLLFLTQERLRTSAGYQEVLEVSDRLIQQGVAPVFILAERNLTAHGSSAQRRSHAFLHYFLEEAGQGEAALPRYKNDFMSACVRNNWELIVV